jgi:hypothetical protein
VGQFDHRAPTEEASVIGYQVERPNRDARNMVVTTATRSENNFVLGVETVASRGSGFMSKAHHRQSVISHVSFNQRSFNQVVFNGASPRPGLAAWA